MKRICIYIIFIVIAGSCKEKFVPSFQSPSTGYLVVEGFISSSQQPTIINLSRTTKLNDPQSTAFELNASVTIESDNNETFPLSENSNGEYISSPLHLNDNEKYRLHIKTQDNKEYASDFTKVQHTPVIDSLSFAREDGGLKIYVNSHDPSDNAKYFKWDYEETWEYHSKYKSNIKFVNDPVTQQIELGPRDPANPYSDTLVYKCWHTNISTNILLGSTEKLTANQIHLPIMSIEPHSEKLSVLYYIHLRQYALSHEGYLFYQKIKKNTEEVGSIFDAQPSELKGNIHSLTDASEIVIGYVDISEETEKQIYISNDQVPGWGYAPDCPFLIIDISAVGLGLEPISVNKVDGFGAIVNFSASYPDCVVCTLRGTNIKPAFWP